MTAHQESGYATPESVERQAETWSNDILLCRTYGHRWHPRNAVHNKRLHYFEITQVCDRCTTERYTEMSETGHVYASWYSYSEGYLAKGLGRIAGEARDVIRVASVMRAFPVRVMSTVEAKEPPRSALTKQAVGLTSPAYVRPKD